jgi:proteic killer suppression protein
MIVSFRHKGLRNFLRLVAWRNTASPCAPAKFTLGTEYIEIVEDMDQPGFNFHMLGGLKKTRWSVNVSGNWRLTFEFENGNAYIIDYEDYH